MYRSCILLLATVLALCSGHNANDHDQQSGEAEAHEHSDDEIILEPDDAARFGVVTRLVSDTIFFNSINATGVIDNSPSDIAVISAPTAGILTLSPGITAGANVNSGQSIASVSAASVSGGDPNKVALANLRAAKKELDRLEPLLADGIVTRRDYNAALAQYEAAKAAYSPAASSGRVSAPFAGIITTLDKKSGDYVDAGAPIASVARNTALIIKVDVPEKYRSELADIRSASIRLPYTESWISIDSLGGSFVSTDARSLASSSAGYIPLYIRIDGNGLISNGGFVDVCLLSGDSSNVIAVEREALVEQMGNYFLFVKTSGHSYEKRLVTIGSSNGNLVQITDGLNPGEEVVIKGATTVKLAENSGAVPEGHSHQH